jgi:DNA-binding CsgD family transcriptional regulator
MEKELTKREQEILIQLLEGKAIKEIAYILKIKYPTVVFHQKNIYKKLGVQNNNDLLVKYNIEQYKQQAIASAKTINTTFSMWGMFKDDYGSSVGMTIKDEKINGKIFTCCTVFGTLFSGDKAHAGVMAHPVLSALENMKTMSSFSFTVLGDGNTYEVLIATADTIIFGEKNHFRKKFKTKKGEIKTIKVNINELSQHSQFGKVVQLDLNNIENLLFQAYNTGSFKLKIWNVIVTK